jgi:hypothetical protein
MSWADAMTVLATNLATAGATLTPAIQTVVEGEPDTVNVPAFAYWYVGDRDGTQIPNSVATTDIEEGVDVTLYWPGSVRFPSGNQTVERWLHDATRAAKHALWEDFTLGGNVASMEIEPAAAGWATVGGAVCRIVTFTVWLAETDVDTFTP